MKNPINKSVTYCIKNPNQITNIAKLSTDEIKAKHHLHQKSHQQTHHRNAEKHHLGHFVRHHRGLKAREANSSFCLRICDLELAAGKKTTFLFVQNYFMSLFVVVAGWFNSTNELKLFYSLIPPSVKQIIFGNISINATFSNVSISATNITFANGSISINLNSFYDATAEWPILTYFAKLIGHFLSQAHGLSELFKLFPGFASIWKIILHGLSGEYIV